MVDIVGRITRASGHLKRSELAYSVAEGEDAAAEIKRLRQQMSNAEGSFWVLAENLATLRRQLAETRDAALEEAAEIADGQGEPAVAMEIRALKGPRT